MEIGTTDWSAYVLDNSDLKNEVELVKGTSQIKCRFFRNKGNFIKRIWKTAAQLTDPERDNIRQEIRAICSNWLKMQNVCALFGAGASKCILGFVGKDMYSKIKTLLKDRPSIKLLKTLEGMSSNATSIDTLFEEYLSQLTLLSKILFEKTKPLDKTTVKLPLDFPLKNKRPPDLLLNFRSICIDSTFCFTSFLIWIFRLSR